MKRTNVHNLLDKRSSAVALAYHEADNSPRVVAKGSGKLAERIIDRAKETGVFVHESPELVRLLMQVDLDSHIPPQLYQAVAEVLSFVYQLEKQVGKEKIPFEQILKQKKANESE